MILKGNDRHQLEMTCLEDRIPTDSVVRIIDLFIDACKLESFLEKGTSHEGRPGYSNADLLKLYIYSYLHKTRSSRDIAKLTKVNNEVRWLLRGLSPCHMTISNFRKQNKDGFIALFKAFNGFLRGENVFDQDTVAVDGALFAGQNSQAKNYTDKKVNKALKQVDAELVKYLTILDANDKVKQEQQIDIEAKLEQLKQRKDRLSQVKQQIELAKQQGQTQVSLTDPDARRLMKGKGKIGCTGYNLVTAVEVENKFIVGVHVTNKNDINELARPSSEAKQALGKSEKESIKTIADKGFDSGGQLKECAENNIETYVAPRQKKSPNRKTAFGIEDFIYNKAGNYYLCPEGQQLTTTGKVYQKKRKTGNNWNKYSFIKYSSKSAICKTCPHFNKCCPPSGNKRIVERIEYQDYIDENIKRVSQTPSIYKKRMATVEHPFGTIKRQWGFNYTLLKTLPKVTGEFNLICTVYNLRRSISILGINKLMERLRSLCFYHFSPFELIFRHFELTFKNPNLG